MAIFYINDLSGDGLQRLALNDVADICDDCEVNQPPAQPFRIVKVGGLTKEQCLAWIAVHYDMTNHDAPTPTMRREYKFDPTKLTTTLRNAFTNNRYVELTQAQARKCLMNKTTGQYEG